MSLFPLGFCWKGFLELRLPERYFERERFLVAIFLQVVRKTARELEGEREKKKLRKTKQRALVRERIPESTERRGCREESRESFH